MLNVRTCVRHVNRAPLLSVIGKAGPMPLCFLRAHWCILWQADASGSILWDSAAPRAHCLHCQGPSAGISRTIMALDGPQVRMRSDGGSPTCTGEAGTISLHLTHVKNPQMIVPTTASAADTRGALQGQHACTWQVDMRTTRSCRKHVPRLMRCWCALCSALAGLLVHKQQKPKKAMAASLLAHMGLMERQVSQ